MFLSQLSLDRIDRQAMRLLSDIYSLHKAVMSGFTAYTDGPRVLFRVEPEVQEGMVRLLVQSEVEPSWHLFSERCKGLVDKTMKEFPLSFSSGAAFRFRLRANPTVTRNGKRYGLVRDESLEGWLRKKEERLGVRFRSLSAIDEGYVTGQKTGHRVNLKMARFEGYLCVTDSALLQKAFAEGIGSAKAFGCGLLSLARV